jgi:hypothetical protein
MTKPAFPIEKSGIARLGLSKDAIKPWRLHSLGFKGKFYGAETPHHLD